MRSVILVAVLSLSVSAQQAEPTDAGRGPTRCAGPADADAATVDAGHIAAIFAGRCAVHAGYDHASCAGG